MKRYDSYKDSGVEWIGEIPSQWGLKKIKQFTKILTGSTPKSTEESYWNGEINWVTTDDLGKLKSKEIHESRRKISQEGYANSGTYLAPENSIILSTRAPIGHLGILKIEACTNQGCKTIVANPSFDSIYLFYFLFVGKGFLNSLGIGTTFIELPTQSLKDFRVPYPDVAEQTTIATYLDRKTAEIDELIADKKRLLQLYEEEKTAIINQAVTKGLNHDCKGLEDEHDLKKSSNQANQKNQGSRQFKDSGIEWLGEIPEGWEVKKLKYVAEIVLGKMLTSEDKGGYFLKPYLRAANLNWLKVNVDDVKEMWFSEKELDKYRLNAGDLLVSEGGEVGRTCIWNEELPECYIQNSVHKVVMCDNCNSDYFLQLFYLYGKKGAFDLIVNRISIAHLTVEKLKGVEFVVPSIEEQQSIVHHIETECNRIDTQMQRIQKLIELLTEYRTALISEVVTGKIKITP